MTRTYRRVVIGGASGMLGQALIRALNDRGFTCVALSRTSKPVPGAIKTVVWDAKSVGEWSKELEGSFAVVNLSGSTIATLWTDDAKRDIVSSRVDSTRAISEAICLCSRPPRVWLAASAIGIYGDTGEELKEESDPIGHDFLAEVGSKWEAAQTNESTPKTVQSRLRIGVVLAREGGALPKWVQLTKAFLGGQVGDGSQWISWIHIDDLVEMMIWLIEGERAGAWNGVAPEPVRNRELMSVLRAKVGRPWSPPAPAALISALRPMIKVEPYLALVSQRISAEKALDAGFTFKYGTIDSAIDNLVP